MPGLEVEENSGQRSSLSSVLKLLLRLLPFEGLGEVAESSGSVPNGDSASSMRSSSSRCSSFRVALKKSVKCDSGSEKVVEEASACSPEELLLPSFPAWSTDREFLCRYSGPLSSSCG